MNPSAQNSWERLLDHVDEGSPTERLLAIQQAATHVLAQSETLEEALPQVLRAICLTLDWQVGAGWSIDSDAAVLRCDAVWHDPSIAVPGFARVTRSMTFAHGVGLLGRVWEKRAPVFIPDVTLDENSSRAPVAFKEGLHGAIAFPILIGNEVSGCLEFFSQQIEPPDESLYVTMAAVGMLVGLFVQRTRAVAAVRASEARKSALLEERAQIQLQLEDAVRARDEFLSIAAHELRTPLTSLLLQLQIVLRALSRPGGDEGGPSHVRMMEMSIRQAQRLANLINSLLDVSRVASGRLELHLERFDLGDVVAAALEALEEPAERVGSTLTLREQSGLLGDWDRLRIEQVVTNLVTNALKYAPGAPVEVTVAERERHVVLVVRDGGPGIPPERLGRVFERFERFEGSAVARAPGGLGLGLYITRQIVEAHGGTIALESTPGAGCVFTIELPLEPPSG